MRVAVQKLEGVEAVTVSLERAVADIRLRAGNKVTLPELRRIVKNNGFTSKEAAVTVVGTLVERGGKPALDVTGTGTVLALEPDPAARDVYRQIEEWRRGNTTASVEVAGTVATRGEDAPDAIVVRTARRVEGGPKR